MNILKHPIFIGICALALAIYFAKLSHVDLPNWVYFYLSNLLCMPFVFSLCLVVIRLINKDHTLHISLGPIFALTVLYAMYFEWLLPQCNARYTADIIDVIMYILGACLFYRFQKQLYC